MALPAPFRRRLGAALTTLAIAVLSVWWGTRAYQRAMA